MSVVLQSESSECGLACLAMICRAHKLRIDLDALRRRFVVSLKGATLQQIMQHADVLNFSCRPLRVDLHELVSLRLPCVLHWNLNHFVVLTKVAGHKLVILDPAVGERRLSLSQVSDHFTGVALELTPNAKFETNQTEPSMRLRNLTGRVHGLKRALFHIFLLALALQVFAIAAPLLNQWVVDEAISTYDKDLLGVLLIGFALLLLVQTAIGLARSWMSMTLGMSLSLQWSSNLFTHLLKLPIPYFEKRHLGDIVSRFGAIGSIQRTLTSSLLEALLDGCMSVATVGMMFLYSPQMSMVTLGTVLLYAGLRWAGYGPFREAAAERLIVAAQEQTHFLESIRAIVPLKLFGREQDRCARWQNLLVEVQNRDTRTTKMAIAFGTANTLLFSLANLAVLWLGANLVMESNSKSVFTIGMLFAFISYKDQFVGRTTALIDYVVELKMLGLHADRLADIALTLPEPTDPAQHSLEHLRPSIELKNVCFRYGESEPWVLRNVNLRLEAGESVAIVGGSGCGKTTLLKILLGLMTPDEGELLYGGMSVKHLGLQNYRRVMGSVMQEDVLLAGSIADNVSFFDVRPDHDRVEQCIRLAAVYDIVNMPMGFQTLVGDMGSSLSGGQKQRILLARALYKAPKVLALDEATSHLDILNEKRVTEALAQLPLTRIIVAHRPETIAGAQRVVQLKGGEVSELDAAVVHPQISGFPGALHPPKFAAAT